MIVNEKLKTQPWPLAKLKDYRLQASIFGDLPEPEFQAFVADLEKRKLQTPIEILPDGTILAGHQRVRAARRLGWKTISAVVRHDLAEAGAAAVEQHFLSDNLRRRQLSPLGRARCIQRLMDMQTDDELPGPRGSSRETVKLRIGKELGLSARSVSRYLLILETPMAVQNACDRGALPLTTAGRVALAPTSVQAGIARRIEAGETPRTVVDSTLRKSTTADDPIQAFRRLVRAVLREEPRIVDHVHAIEERRIRANAKYLRAGISLFQELIQRASS